MALTLSRRQRWHAFEREFGRGLRVWLSLTQPTIETLGLSWPLNDIAYPPIEAVRDMQDSNYQQVSVRLAILNYITLIGHTDQLPMADRILGYYCHYCTTRATMLAYHLKP